MFYLSKYLKENKNKKSSCSQLWMILALLFSFVEITTFGQPAMKQDGFNQLRYPNGQVASEGITKNGKPEGLWKNYYETGVIKSIGNRKNHQLDGIWKFYDEKGELTTEISYQADQKNGLTWKYENGKLIEKVFFVDNKRQGEGLSFYETGELKSKVNYVDDLKDREGFEYGKDGRIISILKYHKDVLISKDDINRFNKDSEKTGKWVEFHDNGINELVGTFIGGKKNGIFKQYDRNGKLLAIFKYEDDKLSETSTGVDILEEKKNYYPNGNVKTISTYRDGKLQGYVRQYDSTGQVTSSTKYDNGVKLAEGVIDSLAREQGPWKYFYDSGELQAEGTYLDAKKIGEWKYYFINGALEQVGQYKNGIADGKWMWYYDNTKIHREETYKNGLEDGNTIEYDYLGYLVLKGKYVEGKRVGNWFYFVGDHLEEGQYRDGNKDGPWIGYYDEEKKNKSFEGSFKDGAEDGVHTYYYPNGLIKEIRQYKVGVRVGKWELNTANGVPYVKTDYKNGEVSKVNGVPVKSDKDKKKK